MSLSAFVSAFEDGKSYNETDLAGLGLDLECEGPLLPMLHSVLSEAPLLTNSCHPIPDYYRECPAVGSVEDKQALLTDQTLMFIFETEVRSKLQRIAAEELTKRGFSFDEETGKWFTRTGNEWSIEEWKEIEGAPMGIE
jgi:hypothetical protein